MIARKKSCESPKRGQNNEVRSFSRINHRNIDERVDFRNYRKQDGNRERRGDFMKNLELSPEQEEAIQTLRTNHRKAIIEKRAQLAKLEVDKENAINAEDTNHAKALIDDIAKLNADIAKMRIDLFENIRVELTPAQREQLKR
jgi:Spy/CpxP family protein refolding chaperone